MLEKRRDKHAYLIIAHNNFEQLQQLIDLLDDERNDIYLHIDKKAKEFREESIKTTHSNLIYTRRLSVIWGGHTQIQCEMELLKTAGLGHYKYYHLLSGADLPLKSQDEIHDFFDNSSNKNYIDYFETNKAHYYYRTQYYYLLRNHIGRKQDCFTKILQRLENLSLKVQRTLRIERKEIVPLYKGANWFSITDELLQYILGKEELIKKQFYYSICGDEVFLQSIAMASPYRDSIVKDALRAVDWKRGTPYVYHEEDVQGLIESKNMFGRKFDSSIDQRAIDLVSANIKQRG